MMSNHRTLMLENVKDSPTPKEIRALGKPKQDGGWCPSRLGHWVGLSQRPSGLSGRPHTAPQPARPRVIRPHTHGHSASSIHHRSTVVYEGPIARVTVTTFILWDMSTWGWRCRGGERARRCALQARAPGAAAPTCPGRPETARPRARCASKSTCASKSNACLDKRWVHLGYSSTVTRVPISRPPTLCFSVTSLATS
eukprot:3679038-Prymnesium_polylepis.2